MYTHATFSFEGSGGGGDVFICTHQGFSTDEFNKVLIIPREWHTVKYEQKM